MRCKALLAEVATGIIVNTDAQSWHITGGDLPYIFFDSLAEAINFANAVVKANPNLEVGIWNESGAYERTITVKTS